MVAMSGYVPGWVQVGGARVVHIPPTRDVYLAPGVFPASSLSLAGPGRVPLGWPRMTAAPDESQNEYTLQPGSRALRVDIHERGGPA